MKVSVLVFFCCLAFTFGSVAHGETSALAQGKIQENLERLIQSNNCPSCDLTGVDLNRVDLSGANLEGAILVGVKFFLANLSGANLQGANLQGAGMGGADLANADLRGANLTGAVLDGAYLIGAKMDGEVKTRKKNSEEDVAGVGEKYHKRDEKQSKPKPVTSDMTISKRTDLEEVPSTPVVPEQKVPEAKEIVATPKKQKQQTGEKQSPSQVPEQKKSAPKIVDKPLPSLKNSKKLIAIADVQLPPEKLKEISGGFDDDITPAASQEEIKEEQANIAESNTLSESGASDNEPGFFDQIGKSIQSFFGDSAPIVKEEKSETFQTVESQLEPAKQEIEVALNKPEAPANEPLVEEVFIAAEAEPVIEAIAKEEITAVPNRGEDTVKAQQAVEETVTEVKDTQNQSTKPALSHEERVLEAWRKELKEKLLDEKRCVACDLSGVDLSGKNLSGVDLERATLRNSNLAESDLSEANLKGADLSGSNLRNVVFDEADLYNANFTDTDCTGATFTDSLIDSADFTGALGLKLKEN